MIRVLIVEDSPVIREFMIHILKSDPEIDVIGTANNGVEALKFLQSQRPDVITMDINMPRMNGFEATRRIMETCPLPIVIVSGSWNTVEVATTFRALEAGALAILPRPSGIGHPDHEVMAKELIQMVKFMSEMKVVRRWPSLIEKKSANLSPFQIPPIEERKDHWLSREIQIVAIGASTGGPLVLQTILSQLGENFPLPILVVQHIAPGFLPGFAKWLSESTTLPIHIAAPGDIITGGNIYLAPDGFQMGVNHQGQIQLCRKELPHEICPSVSYLFRSVNAAYGPNAVGILLTGMGRDGAEELKIMKEQGAITIAQDEDSSVIFGMPGEAVKLQAAQYVLPPEKIANKLEQLVEKKGLKYEYPD